MSNTEAAFLNSLSSQISYYFVIVSSSIGIPFNILSILIFAKLMRNKTNMGFLGIIHAAVDLVLLLLMLFVIRSSPLIFSFSLANQSDAACKLLTFLRRFSLHVSSWIPVVITFDRFAFVLYGNGDKFKFMKDKRKLSALIFAIFVIIAIADIPNLLFYLNRTCTANFDITISSDIISILLRTYLPFGLMIVFNLLMILKIFKSSRSTARQSSLNRKEYQFTLAVIAFDVYFFVLNFPLSLYYIFSDVNNYSGAFSGNALFSARYNLASAITVNLSFCPQTFSFFMYLAFNKLFRREVLRFMWPSLRLLGASQIEPTRINTTRFVPTQEK